MSRKRMTKQRQAILQALNDKNCHPTADEIYFEVRKKIPNISLGTIYRNLNVLLEMNKIREIYNSPKYARYDANPKPHYHFQCQKCDRVCDVHLPYQRDLDKLIADNELFDVHHHTVVFFGLCEECQKKSKD